ncbi:uncharacterized protein FOMMEDRAFT_153470, partial [Fomitiporia mediterranea MF3/22]|uniref:uncharacterized protein n=1 Tax=Fomitiporia mediterranea (strain MF3/22) TaxID=694068 RepID=UPI0004407D81
MEPEKRQYKTLAAGTKGEERNTTKRSGAVMPASRRPYRSSHGYVTLGAPLRYDINITTPKGAFVLPSRFCLYLNFTTPIPPSSFSITSSSATYHPGRTPKASVLKRLKKFIGSSQASSSHPQSSTIRTTLTESERRRAEALKACGLLGQSIKYGGPYRDEGDDDDAKTIISSEKQADDGTWEMKDLLDFDEKTELPKGAQDYECSINTIEDDLISVDSPETPPVPLQRHFSVSTSSDTSPTVESETSTLSPQRAPIR